MRKISGTRVFALAVLAVFFAAKTEAATISVSPAFQNPAVGGSASVDIVVGLAAGEELGGIQFDLAFNSAILSGVSYSLDPSSEMGFATCQAEAAGDPFEPACDFSFGFNGGAGSPLNVVFLANDELNEAQLEALQGASVIVARVNFLAMAAGLSPLTLQNVVLSDWTGFDNLNITQTNNGSVCVGNANCEVQPPQPGEIPEPGTLTLLGLGGSALLARRRRKAAKKQ